MNSKNYTYIDKNYACIDNKSYTYKTYTYKSCAYLNYTYIDKNYAYMNYTYMNNAHTTLRRKNAPMSKVTCTNIGHKRCTNYTYQMNARTQNCTHVNDSLENYTNVNWTRTARTSYTHVLLTHNFPSNTFVRVPTERD